MNRITVFCKIKIGSHGRIEGRGFWTGIVTKCLRHMEAIRAWLMGRLGKNITMWAMWQPAGSRRAVDGFRSQVHPGGCSTQDQLSCCFLLPQNPSADSFIWTMDNIPFFSASPEPHTMSRNERSRTNVAEQSPHQMSSLWVAATTRRVVRALVGWVSRTYWLQASTWV